MMVLERGKDADPGSGLGMNMMGRLETVGDGDEEKGWMRMQRNGLSGMIIIGNSDLTYNITWRVTWNITCHSTWQYHITCLEALEVN